LFVAGGYAFDKIGFKGSRIQGFKRKLKILMNEEGGGRLKKVKYENFKKRSMILSYSSQIFRLDWALCHEQLQTQPEKLSI